MLARRMQDAREAGADRVRVLHLSPAGNRALHRVTAPALRRFGGDALKLFRALLDRPDDFVGASIKDAFGPDLAAVDPDASDWAEYLRRRYAFLDLTAAQKPA